MAAYNGAVMTTWQLHLLNSRNALTSVMSEIRASLRETLAKVADHAEVPNFDLVARADTSIADWGLRATTPGPGIIEIAINPARWSEDYFQRTLVRELHHLIRWERPGYGRSLGEALVSEGLAGHFVTQVLGGQSDPWDAMRPSSGVARQALNEWARRDFDHARWFLGKGDLRRWSGYGIGHRLIAEHLSQIEGQDVVSLSWAPADQFRAAMRRLVAADTGDADLEDLPEEIADEPETENNQESVTQTELDLASERGEPLAVTGDVQGEAEKQDGAGIPESESESAAETAESRASEGGNSTTDSVNGPEGDADSLSEDGTES